MPGEERKKLAKKVLRVCLIWIDGFAGRKFVFLHLQSVKKVTERKGEKYEVYLDEMYPPSLL